MKLLDVLALRHPRPKKPASSLLKQGHLDLSLSRHPGQAGVLDHHLHRHRHRGHSLGLHMVADLFNKIVLLHPNIIVAIWCWYSASWWHASSTAWCLPISNNMGCRRAHHQPRCRNTGVIIFVVFVALEQLAIGTTLLTARLPDRLWRDWSGLRVAFGLGGPRMGGGVIRKADEK